MKKFEYKIIDLKSGYRLDGEDNTNEITNIINKLGMEGWELSGVLPSTVICNSMVDTQLFFKRELF